MTRWKMTTVTASILYKNESDETLAGTIIHLAEEPNSMVAQLVADEMMTRYEG